MSCCCKPTSTVFRAILMIFLASSAISAILLFVVQFYGTWDTYHILVIIRIILSLSVIGFGVYALVTQKKLFHMICGISALVSGLFGLSFFFWISKFLNSLTLWTWKVYVTFPVVISCFDFVICGLMATFYCNDSEDKIINQNDQQGEPMSDLSNNLR